VTETVASQRSGAAAKKKKKKKKALNETQVEESSEYVQRKDTNQSLRQ
jgi:hypothetical protein